MTIRDSWREPAALFQLPQEWTGKTTFYVRGTTTPEPDWFPIQYSSQAKGGVTYPFIALWLVLGLLQEKAHD